MPLQESQVEQLLIDGEFLNKVDLGHAKEVSANKKIPLIDAVIDLGLLSEDQALSLITEEEGSKFVNLSKERIDPSVLFLIPESVAHAQNVVAYKKTPEKIYVAMLDPDDYDLISLLQKTLGSPIEAIRTSHAGLSSAFKGYQKDIMEQARILVARMAKQPQEEDVVKLVNILVEAAYRNAASDIHIEPEEDSIVVRLRVHGDLHEVLRYPKSSHDKVVFRIKILSRLRTDEHAQAQDGRFEMKFSDGRVNLRVSILPITHGENIVMRLLSEGFQRLRLEDLGLLEDDFAKVKHASELPIRHDRSCRTDRFRKNNHSVCGFEYLKPTGRQHHYHRRSGGIQHTRHQTNPGKPRNKPHVRSRFAVDPAPRPGHRHGR